MSTLSSIVLPVVTINKQGLSIFSEQAFELQQRGGMFLSEQQQAVNFRLRKSAAGYVADWHVAGDPTLITVLEGVLRITLRDGQYKDFSAGDMFVAKDRLLDNQMFNNELHGHRAQVIGDVDLAALHLKLESL